MERSEIKKRQKRFATMLLTVLMVVMYVMPVLAQSYTIRSESDLELQRDVIISDCSAIYVGETIAYQDNTNIFQSSMQIVIGNKGYGIGLTSDAKSFVLTQALLTEISNHENCKVYGIKIEKVRFSSGHIVGMLCDIVTEPPASADTSEKEEEKVEPFKIIDKEMSEFPAGTFVAKGTNLLYDMKLRTPNETAINNHKLLLSNVYNKQLGNNGSIVTTMDILSYRYLSGPQNGLVTKLEWKNTGLKQGQNVYVMIYSQEDGMYVLPAKVNEKGTVIIDNAKLRQKMTISIVTY